MIKLKKQKRKYRLIPKLADLYQVYLGLLKNDEDFTWTLRQFIWNTQFKKQYSVTYLRTSDKRNFLFILLLNFDFVDDRINIINAYIDRSILEDARLLQAFNVHINQYGFAGHKTVAINIKDYDKELERLFETYSFFKCDNILSSIKGNKRTITLIKKL